MTRRPNFVIFSEQASSRDKKKGGTFFERVPPFSVFMSGIFCGIECFYLGNTVLRGDSGNAGNRDSINVKVFEEEGVGSGEGEGKLSPESFPSLSPCSLNSPSSHLHPCAACRRTWRRPPTGKARCSRLHHWGKPLCRCLRTWKGRPARGTTARA